MRRMRLAALLACVAALIVTGAAAGSPAGGKQAAAPTQLTIWVGWSARELGVFKQVVAEYDKSHPNVTVNVVGNINDNKIVAAIRAGVVRLERNYALAHDAAKVVARPAATRHGALVGPRDECRGPVLASMPLPDPAQAALPGRLLRRPAD